MIRTSCPTGAARRPWTAFLWGWGLVLVVLLSAAPTGGAPRTRMVGSAFDPATVSEALNPRQPKLKAALKQAARGEPGKFLPDPQGDLAVVAVPEVGTPDRAEPTRWGTSHATEAQRLVRPLGARAPPLS